MSKKAVGNEKNYKIRLYTSLNIIWEIIFYKRPCIKWCQITILGYKQQLEKIFEGRATSSEKAALIFILQKNTTTSNNIFNLQFLANTCK